MKALLLLPAFVLATSGVFAASPDEPDVRADKKLQGLLEELERARNEGEDKKVEKIQREIQRIEDRAFPPLPPRGGEADERASEDLIDRIAQLRKEAIRAKREGAADRAKEAWSEADRLEHELQGRMAADRGKRRSRGEDPKTEDLLRDIKEKTRAMTQEGKVKSKELAAKAKELSARAKELDKEGQQDKAEALRREAEEVRAKGEALAREFQERAEKFRRDAEERMENRFRNGGAPEKPLAPVIGKPPAPPRPPKPPPLPPPNGFNGEPREDLRQEIDRLRSEVRELREVLKRSLEEKPRGAEKEKGPPSDQPKQSF